MNTANKKIFTVSRLNQEVQKLLESGFGTLWLQGEISNFSRPASGHYYLTLKDSQSQIRCAMFKGRNRYIDFEPQNGDSVLVRGKLGLYSPRGDYQLIIEHMEAAGAGKLQAQFEATKRKLDEQGWFDQSRKKALPSMPGCIGIITSPTGAALRDVLHVLSRRYRQSRVIIYPTPTQGAAAAPTIARAIRQANRRAEADVLLLVRGGGSLEDLWAFNELGVAQAILDSEIPLVAGVGHEVDVTISDLVSDLRAPTPSAAAELATPDANALHQRVAAATLRLARLQRTGVERWQTALQQQTARLHLRHPQRLLFERSQRVDELTQRLTQVMRRRLESSSAKHAGIRNALAIHSPDRTLQRFRSRSGALDARLNNAIHTHQQSARSRFELLARTLNSVSPLAVLDRGYALIRKGDELVMNVSSVMPGDEVTARLSNGEIQAEVKAIRPSS